MLFELHLTVDTDFSQRQIDDWQKLCKGRGHKPLLIRLDAETAKNPRQLMNAIVFESSSVNAAFEALCTEVYEYSHSYSGKHRFKVIRAKLEVPLDHSEGLDVAYYETHVKALLDAGQADLLRAAESLGIMHASQNLLKTDDAGREKWYATKRDYGNDMFSAAEEFNGASMRLMHTLPSAFVRMESEAVIFDTNPRMDEGWAHPA